MSKMSERRENSFDYNQDNGYDLEEHDLYRNPKQVLASVVVKDDALIISDSDEHLLDIKHLKGNNFAEHLNDQTQTYNVYEFNDRLAAQDFAHDARDQGVDATVYDGDLSKETEALSGSVGDVKTELRNEDLKQDLSQEVDITDTLNELKQHKLEL